MSIILFAPFASLNPEAGLLYLFANYLRSQRHDISQLRCNGIFPRCDRDSENLWKRNLRSCVECIGDQRGFAKWSGIDSRELSSFILPEEIEETSRGIRDVPGNNLMAFRFKGVPLFDLCKGSVRALFGTDLPQLMDSQQVEETRALLLSTLRMSVAVRRLNNTIVPKVALVIGGQDYLTRTFVAQSMSQGVEVCVFQWNLSERVVDVIHLKDNRVLPCELVIDNVKTMRNNPDSWAPELVQHLQQIIDFIPITQPS